MCYLPVRQASPLDLFGGSLDVKAGTAIGACHPRHRGIECRPFLATIEAHVPADRGAFDPRRRVHPQGRPDPQLARHAAPRYHLHLTPASAPWLNLVESWELVRPAD